MKKLKSNLFLNQLTLWNKQINSDVNHRMIMVLFVLCAGFFIIFLANVLSHINTETWHYDNPEVIPALSQVGNDFRVGYYWPAQYLISTKFSAIGPNDTYPSNYPPLVAFSSLPYLLFNDKVAYLIHVGLLVLANIACLGMTIKLVKDYFLCNLGIEKNLQSVFLLFIFFLFVIYTFNSYFFAYSMERGNTDIFALFFSLLAIWFLLKKPDNIWLQVIILSVAVHFKIYPAALFVVLYYKHGKKIILPALIVNIIYLFCLGPTIALGFIKSVTSGGSGAGMGNQWSSGLNHAAYSLAIFVDKTSDKFLSSTFFIIFGVLMLIPIVLWGIAVISVAMNKYSTQNAILLLMVTIPLMDLVPTASIDYKLVIECSAALLLIGIIIKQLLQKNSWFDLFQLIIVMFLLCLISWSFQPFDYSYVLFEDKYVWVLLLEVMMVLNIIKNQKPEYHELVNT